VIETQSRSREGRFQVNFKDTLGPPLRRPYRARCPPDSGGA
jgi:hypothetical protein